ncbi:MAG: hypothetical protein M3Y33_00745 [Actinomycetota bacterium]|nr:hypothetical protein [Actinomycetota bacterium]
MLEFAPLLRALNAAVPLAGYVITAAAGHTVRTRATSCARTSSPTTC